MSFQNSVCMHVYKKGANENAWNKISMLHYVSVYTVIELIQTTEMNVINCIYKYVYTNWCKHVMYRNSMYVFQYLVSCIDSN